MKEGELEGKINRTQLKGKREYENKSGNEQRGEVTQRQRKEGIRCKKWRTRARRNGRKAAADEEAGAKEWVRCPQVAYFLTLQERDSN